MKTPSAGAAALAGALFFAVAAVPAAHGADSKKEFVGSEKCKSCHSEEFKSWKATFHAKMVQPRKGGILQGGRGEVEERRHQPRPHEGERHRRPVHAWMTCSTWSAPAGNSATW